MEKNKIYVRVDRVYSFQKKWNFKCFSLSGKYAINSKGLFLNSVSRKD